MSPEGKEVELQADGTFVELALVPNPRWWLTCSS